MSGRQQAKDRQLANTQDAVRRADWLLTGTGSVPDALVRSPVRVWQARSPRCPYSRLCYSAVLCTLDKFEHMGHLAL
jgi:hypothetical protein